MVTGLAKKPSCVFRNLNADHHADKNLLLNGKVSRWYRNRKFTSYFSKLIFNIIISSMIKSNTKYIFLNLRTKFCVCFSFRFVYFTRRPSHIIYHPKCNKLFLPLSTIN